MKRLILIFILLLVIAFAVIYFVWFRFPGSNLQVVDPNDTNTSSGIVSVPTGGTPAGTGFGPDGTLTGAVTKLFRIHPGPVSGFTTFERNEVDIVDDARTTKTRTLVRYIERISGHISDYVYEDNVYRKITNTNIPRIFRAFFSNVGNALGAHQIEDNDLVRTFTGTVGTSTDSQIVAQYLDNNLLQATPSPDGKKLLIGRVGTLSYELIVANIDGTNGSIIFTSSISEWSAHWITNDLVALGSKAKNGDTGTLFTINTRNGSRTKILSEQGLKATYSPKGDRILYSISNSNGIFTFIRQPDGEDIQLTVRTMAEKCAWAPNNTTVYCAVPKNTNGLTLPDDWYKGTNKISDSVYEINGVTGASTLLFDPSQIAQGNMDMYMPKVTPDGDYFVFLNKSDLALWSYMIDVPTTATSTEEN